jgi:hypothetical protein
MIKDEIARLMSLLEQSLQNRLSGEGPTNKGNDARTCTSQHIPIVSSIPKLPSRFHPQPTQMNRQEATIHTEAFGHRFHGIAPEAQFPKVSNSVLVLQQIKTMLSHNHFTRVFCW